MQQMSWTSQKKCLVKNLLQQPLIIICQEIIPHSDSFSHTPFIKRYPTVKPNAIVFSCFIRTFIENKDFTHLNVYFKECHFFTYSNSQKHYWFHFAKLKKKLIKPKLTLAFIAPYIVVKLIDVATLKPIWIFGSKNNIIIW